MKKCTILKLGEVNYDEALSFQFELVERVKEQKGKESFLILLEHYPVITIGKNGNGKNILVSKEILSKKGITLRHIDRGGDVTYHGPGQNIAYPIFNLSYFKKDIHFFLRRLEYVVVGFLADFGISGLRREGLTGVWIGKKKIASLGIAIRHWITFHGLSINIKTEDLVNFRLIKPCGMDIEMTSLENELGREIDPDDIKGKIIDQFKKVFGFVK